MGVDIDILMEDTVCTVLATIQKEADLVKAVLYLIAILAFYCCWAAACARFSYVNCIAMTLVVVELFIDLYYIFLCWWRSLQSVDRARFACSRLFRPT